LSEPATSENITPAGGAEPVWLPEVQCPPESAPINGDTVSALRRYINKIEIEHSLCLSTQQVELRDSIISSLNDKLAERDAQVRSLRSEVEDLTKIVEQAAAGGTVMINSSALPPSNDAAGPLLFKIDKEQWKNRLITTLGFAESAIFMHFSPAEGHRLLRVQTDREYIDQNVPEPPPV
jgi:hypothetical protein